MLRILGFFFCFLTAATPAFADNGDDLPRLLGHDVSATGHVLPSHQCTVGTFYFGCAVNDRLTFISSPQLYWNYHLHNFVFRYQYENTEEHYRTVEFDYFKNFRDRDDPNDPHQLDNFVMEAIWLRYIYTEKFRTNYYAHFNLHVNYYFDEQLPFSVRRPYEDPSPFQLNLTVLNEVYLVHGWFLEGEAGFLDFANWPLHTHEGVTIGKKWKQGFFYIGFTQTSTLRALFAPTDRVDYQQVLKDNVPKGYYSRPLDHDSIKNDFSVHPEIAAQYFF